MSFEFAAKDLAHSRNVLNRPGHTADAVRVRDTDAVTGVDDWRTRIRAILALPLLPIHMEIRAMDLPGRLDHLENLRRGVSTP